MYLQISSVKLSDIICTITTDPYLLSCLILLYIHLPFLLTGSNGSIIFTNLPPRNRYTLRIEAQNPNEEPVVLWRRLAVTSDPRCCTLHFINGGVTVNSDQRTAVVEFAGKGPVTSFNCQLDGQGFFPCKMMDKKLL